MSFTEVFGGNTIYPSDVSYLQLLLEADVTLEWPFEAQAGNDIVARIIDIRTDGAFSIYMPDATLTSPGQVVLFNNIGPDAVTVKSSTGTTLLSLTSGTQWEMYLTDNSTATGVWRTFQFGASTAQAQASALAGYGLVAQGDVLSQSNPVVTFNANYTLGDADRASSYVWTGGVGTLTLPAASTVGTDWFFSSRNAGTGNLTITAAGADTINDAATLVLHPSDSATVITDGVSFWTVGLGQDPVFAFDYTSISITGETSPYILSGAELNRIAYQFVGVLTANMVVYVPATTQQYWVSNDTTGGSYTLSIATATQASPIVVTRGARGIYYCNGTDVLAADTSSIATPISVADGGTGATTATAARINLGGTTVGIAVFVAATAAAARTAMSAAALGANSDITSLTGLTTPLTVAQGGTGAATLTGIIKGAGTSAFAAATAGTDYAKPDTISTWSAAQTFSGGISVGTGLTVTAGGAAITGNSTITGSLTYTKTTIGPVGAVAALDVDVSAGDYFTKSISTNSTFTFSNPAASGKSQCFMLELTITSSATPTWPATVKWTGGTAPTLTNGVNLLGFVWNGTAGVWYGSVFASNAA